MIAIAALALAIQSAHPQKTVAVQWSQAEATHFSPAPSSAGGYAAPGLIEAEAKRVAAARGLPVSLVRQLIARHLMATPDGRTAIDVAALNAELDRLEPSR